MKKIIALLLVLCFSLTMVPVFAEETASLTEGRTKIEVSANANTGCGFLDGNMSPANGEEFKNTYGVDNLSQLLGVSNTNDLLAVTKAYVDGKEVRFNLSYNGWTHGGMNGSGNYFYGIVGASLKAGVESTLTILMGNDYYGELKFTPGVSALGVASSSAVLYKEDRVVEVTVTFSEAHGLSVGDTVKGRCHDEHDREVPFTVTAVDGAAVTLKAENYAPTHTLLEFTKTDDVKFTLPIDTLSTTRTAIGYLQTRTNASDPYGVYDARVIVEADDDYINTYEKAVITVTFVTKEGTTRTKTSESTSAFRSLIAAGDVYTAADGHAMVGLQVTGVPYGTKTLSASVTLSGSAVKEDVTKELGSIDLPDLTNQLTKPGYVWVFGEQNIKSSTGKNTGGESAPYLFDKTEAKYGFHSGGNDQTITWEYATPKTIVLYELLSGNDTRGNNLNRNPTRWTLYGSNDRENWAVIDDQPNPGSIGEETHGTFFTVANPQSYQYYKITFGTNSAYFQLAEIRMFEASDKAINLNGLTKLEAPADKSSNPGATYDHEGLDQLFDGDKGSKFGLYSDADTVTFTWNYNAAETVKAYTIVTGGDSRQYNRNPKSWVLYGSVDGNTWVEMSKAICFFNRNGEELTYRIDNPSPYQYYKMVFEVGGHQFQLSEIAFYK